MRLVAGFTAALITMWAGGASAQAEKWRDAPAPKSRAIGIAYARCAVRQSRAAVREYLADPVGTSDAVKLGRALPSKCLDRAIGGLPFTPSVLKASTLLVRGLLFEALYAQDFARLQVALTFEHVPPQKYDVVGVDAAGQTLRHDYRALMKIGECSARAAPEKVRALLSTVATSQAEKLAVADLHDAWTGCLPGHRALQFSVEMTRATLVEPFYRLLQSRTATAGAATSNDSLVAPNAHKQAGS